MDFLLVKKSFRFRQNMNESFFIFFKQENMKNRLFSENQAIFEKQKIR